jgi:hypothetical protein
MPGEQVMMAREQASGTNRRVIASCVRCHGSRWCCELHPDKPEHHRDAGGDECRASGIPCPSCGRTDRGRARELTAARDA